MVTGARFHDLSNELKQIILHQKESDAEKRFYLSFLYAAPPVITCCPEDTKQPAAVIKKFNARYFYFHQF